MQLARVSRGSAWFLPAIMAGSGLLILAGTFGAEPRAARAAAAQVWSPFVLVTGLLLVGLVANDDGVFEWLGSWLTRVSSRGLMVFAASSALVIVVTALLNLDTAVAFLTPVMVHVARRRRGDDAPWLYGVLILANAGSLWLPGSNLTNLIVIGHLHLTGAAFAARIAPAALGASITAVAVAALLGRRSLTNVRVDDVAAPPAIRGGVVSIVLVSAATLLLKSAAVPVAAVGLTAVGWHLRRGRVRFAEVLAVVGPGALVALFATAVALGTLGRTWSGPSQVLAHANVVTTAITAGVATVLVNNLPAAAILAARVPRHPFAMLIGLNLGPNLAVTGSLAWLLWWRSARSAGARPSLRRASRWGAVATVMTMSVALLLLPLGQR